MPSKKSQEHKGSPSPESKATIKTIKKHDHYSKIKISDIYPFVIFVLPVQETSVSLQEKYGVW